jgi:hypothetical protein
MLHAQVAELADRCLLDDLQQIPLGEIKGTLEMATQAARP